MRIADDAGHRWCCGSGGPTGAVAEPVRTIRSRSPRSSTYPLKGD